MLFARAIQVLPVAGRGVPGPLADHDCVPCGPEIEKNGFEFESLRAFKRDFCLKSQSSRASTISMARLNSA